MQNSIIKKYLRNDNNFLEIIEREWMSQAARSHGNSLWLEEEIRKVGLA